MNDSAASQWRTSTYSGSHENCVEVQPRPEQVGIRDTKNREAGSLHLSPKAWADFIGYVTAR